MPNKKAIITGHNKKLLEKESSQQSKPCNCKTKDICPLKGSCRQQSVIWDIPSHTPILPTISDFAEIWHVCRFG